VAGDSEIRSWPSIRSGEFPNRHARLSRRFFLGAAASAALAGPARGTDWASLASGFRVPDWFRDAKFGIWAHWGPQCVAEAGDWYGRLMYVQGHPAYDHHLRSYGHPSETGFIDLIGRWRAERWDPEALVRRYARAGARYFVALACHHDNFDTFDSAHHRWNAVRVGPRRDLIGGWARAARRAGLRFGVSNHASHAWHWWQTAYGYDAEGQRRGRRYDAFGLRARDGRGRYWQGLDPQELYTGPSFVPPDGIGSIQAMNAWHDSHDGQWLEEVPSAQAGFARNWLARQMDLVEKYRPDLVYLDDSGLPFGELGIRAAAHFYAHARGRDGGLDGVLTAKRLSAAQRGGVVEDVERGFADSIRPEPWQTCTCIGNWHYDRGLYERHGYKSAKLVIQRLADIVSKNGNLLLSIPVRGDGSIDDQESAVLDGIESWFRVNGEAIYGTRPWRVHGEGPTRPPSGEQNEANAAPFTSADIRFTQKGAALYAILLDWPEGEIAISSLADMPIERVALLGGGPLPFRRDADALRLTLPRPAGGAMVPVLRMN
jgi:alpha-L-fucosidase